MDSLGINLGYLLVQCLSLFVLILMIALPIYIVYRVVKASRTKQEPQSSSTDQEVLSLYNQLPEDQKKKVLDSIKQNGDAVEDKGE